MPTFDTCSDLAERKEVSANERGRLQIAVLLPELVVRHWWEYFLYNQRVQLLKLLLLVKGKQRIVVINIPWYLGRDGHLQGVSPEPESVEEPVHVSA
jgi:hypothetical protein